MSRPFSKQSHIHRGQAWDLAIAFQGTTIKPNTSAPVRIEEAVFVDSLHGPWHVVSAAKSMSASIHPSVYSFMKPGSPCSHGPPHVLCSGYAVLRSLESAHLLVPLSLGLEHSAACSGQSKAHLFLSLVSQLERHSTKAPQTSLSKETSAAVSRAVCSLETSGLGLLLWIR